MRNTIGRPKTFDKDEVISLAMHYFWEHGYDNSSLDDLLKAMGIKKSSFYRTFKSKEELFSLTLNLYRKELLQNLRNLKNEIGIKQTMIKLVTSTIEDLENDGKIKGCLLMNSGKECYGKYPNLSSQIVSDFNIFIDFFTDMIEESKKNNEIMTKLDSRAIASRFLSIFNGLIVIIQAGANKEVIENVMASIDELIE